MADSVAPVPGSSSRMGVGCATLIAFPFTVVGLFALAFAVRQAVHGDSRNGIGGIVGPAIVGLVFTVLGVGMIASVIAGRRGFTREDAKRQRYASQPWMWRDDWASGRIHSSGRTTLTQAWAFALLWTAGSAALIIAVLRGSVKDRVATLLALIFPIIDVGLIAWAVNTTARHLKFGRSVFEMSEVPARRGGQLSGRIHARFNQPPEDGVVLKLSNIHRTVTSSSDSDSVRDSIVWREEQTVPQRLIAPGMDGWTIPVAFRIPADGIDSSAEIGRDGHLWRLSAEAAVSGTDFREQFDVPVFGKVAAVPVASPDAAARADLRSTMRPAPPPQPTIAVTRTATGGTVFNFAAARNPGVSRAVTVIFALWSAVLGALVSFGAPIIAVIIWGLIDLFIFAGFVGTWFSSSRLTIDANEATKESALFGIGRLRRIPLADIGSVEMPITMQTNDTPYYAIRMILKDGGRITAGSGIRDKREAEWIVAEIRKLAKM